MVALSFGGVADTMLFALGLDAVYSNSSLFLETLTGLPSGDTLKFGVGDRALTSKMVFALAFAQRLDPLDSISSLFLEVLTGLPSGDTLKFGVGDRALTPGLEVLPCIGSVATLDAREELMLEFKSSLGRIEMHRT